MTVSVCICDQAFPHKYPPSDIRLRWQCEHVQDVHQHCSVHPSYMDAHQPSCVQYRHPTTLQAVGQLHGTLSWRTWRNSLQSLKVYLARPLTFFFLRGDLLFDLFCLFLIYYSKWLSNVLPYMHLDDSVKCTDTFYLSGGKTLSIIPTSSNMLRIRILAHIETMANNYGLLWSLSTAAFFLLKDRKNTYEWSCVLVIL